MNVEILDVNDNAPTFDKRIYSLDVKENSLPGSKIGRVQAFDADIGDNARLTYSLNPEVVKFEINKDNGDLILVSPIDFESTSQYTFDVKVKDSGLPSLSSTAKVISAKYFKIACKNIIHIFFKTSGKDKRPRRQRQRSRLYSIGVRKRFN